MKEINELLQRLKKEKERYKELLQPPISSNELTTLRNNFSEELEDEYIKILTFTNGFDNDGVVLYASFRGLINGYKDRFIDGIIEANKTWHEESEKNKFIFYAESELYLFFKCIVNGHFYCVYRDDIKTTIFKTEDKNYFFASIIRLSLGESIE